MMFDKHANLKYKFKFLVRVIMLVLGLNDTVKKYIEQA